MSTENKTLDESSVTANAKAGEPMPKLGADGSSLAGIQDLGGPTPFNSKPDDDSNKMKLLRVVMLLHLQLNHLMHHLQQQHLVTRAM